MVKIKGQLGVKERDRVCELLRKCDEKNKSKVVFEFSEVESLGGSVAKMIGAFVAERSGRGVPPVFVGCSETVEDFLTGRCEQVKPEFFKSLKEAEKFLSTLKATSTRGKSKPSSSKKIPATGSADDAAHPIGAGIALMPDWAEPDGGIATTDAIQAPPPPSDPSSKLNIVEVDKPVPAARYLSLSEAEKTFAAARDLAGMKGAVAALLYGVNLADTCHLMTRRNDELLEVGNEDNRLSTKGRVAEKLLEANTPIPMEDLVSESLSEAETELLTRLNCQMAVPVVVKDALEGALFLRKEQAGSDYGPSEVLALDLLGRKLAHALRQGGDVLAGNAASSGEEAAAGQEMSRKVHQQKALFTIGKEFNSTKDEDHLLSLVLLTTIAQVGVGSAAWFELQGGMIVPRKQRGPDEIELTEMVVDNPEILRDLDEPCMLSDPAAAEKLGGVAQNLSKLGFEFVAPVRGKAGIFGILALGPRLSGSPVEAIDHEFLSILTNQAGVALENARLIRDLHDRTLGVAQTFVNLIEKRSGPGTRASTELISHYVGQIAKNINYPTDQIRDLVYGTVLRDIGMIEISDLVLRSPRSLTPEEWQLIKQHPVTGVEILSGMNFSSTITDVVLYHHERFNGEGYPHGLRGAAIPLGARIVAVVESFVAMTRDLSYRAALSRGEALEVIRENWGMRYDPEVLQAFLEIIEVEGETEPQIETLAGAR